MYNNNDYEKKKRITMFFKIRRKRYILIQTNIFEELKNCSPTSTAGRR